MLREQILNNAQIVLVNEVVHGCVVLENGRIRDISSTLSQSPAAQDMQGDYLMPGFIELHTDNLERYMNPRPGVDWPSSAAVLAHDAQLISSGITTVFDALSIGDVSPKQTRLAQLPKMIEAIGQGMRDGLTRSDHLLHLRCEVSHELTLQKFEELVDHELVRLVSVMDHTPGQRQFVKLEKYKQYYQGKYQLSDAEMEAFIHKQTSNAEKFSEESRKAIVGLCHRKGIALASHDDATAAHVHEAAAEGMIIAEFPTTLEAADLSHKLGLHVLMGAPNIVRGGSHSGNIAAAELASHGVLDILSSDYYPSSMLQAMHRLITMEQGYGIPDAVSTVSLAPAKAVGLHDRGEIAVGKRADLIHVKNVGEQFVVTQVFSQGQRVY